MSKHAHAINSGLVGLLVFAIFCLCTGAFGPGSAWDVWAKGAAVGAGSVSGSSSLASLAASVPTALFSTSPALALPVPAVLPALIPAFALLMLATANPTGQARTVRAAPTGRVPAVGPASQPGKPWHSTFLHEEWSEGPTVRVVEIHGGAGVVVFSHVDGKLISRYYRTSSKQSHGFA